MLIELVRRINQIRTTYGFKDDEELAWSLINFYLGANEVISLTSEQRAAKEEQLSQTILNRLKLLESLLPANSTFTTESLGMLEQSLDSEMIQELQTLSQFIPEISRVDQQSESVSWWRKVSGYMGSFYNLLSKFSNSKFLPNKDSAYKQELDILNNSKTTDYRAELLINSAKQLEGQKKSLEFRQLAQEIILPNQSAVKPVDPIKFFNTDNNQVKPEFIGRKLQVVESQVVDMPINEFVNSNQIAPQIAISDDNLDYVVWQEMDSLIQNSPCTVRLKILDSNGLPVKQELVIDSHTNCNLQEPLTVKIFGNLVIISTMHNDGNIWIFLYDTLGNFKVKIQANTYSSYSPYSYQNPHNSFIDALGDHKYVLVWHSSVSAKVYYRLLEINPNNYEVDFLGDEAEVDTGEHPSVISLGRDEENNYLFSVIYRKLSVSQLKISTFKLKLDQTIEFVNNYPVGSSIGDPILGVAALSPMRDELFIAYKTITSSPQSTVVVTKLHPLTGAELAIPIVLAGAGLDVYHPKIFYGEDALYAIYTLDIDSSIDIEYKIPLIKISTDLSSFLEVKSSVSSQTQMEPAAPSLAFSNDKRKVTIVWHAYMDSKFALFGKKINLFSLEELPFIDPDINQNIQKLNEEIQELKNQLNNTTEEENYEENNEEENHEESNEENEEEINEEQNNALNNKKSEDPLVLSLNGITKYFNNGEIQTSWDAVLKKYIWLVASILAVPVDVISRCCFKFKLDPYRYLYRSQGTVYIKLEHIAYFLHTTTFYIIFLINWGQDNKQLKSLKNYDLQPILLSFLFLIFYRCFQCLLKNKVQPDNQEKIRTLSSIALSYGIVSLIFGIIQKDFESIFKLNAVYVLFDFIGEWIKKHITEGVLSIYAALFYSRNNVYFFSSKNIYFLPINKAIELGVARKLHLIKYTSENISLIYLSPEKILSFGESLLLSIKDLKNFEIKNFKGTENLVKSVSINDQLIKLPKDLLVLFNGNIFYGIPNEDFGRYVKESDEIKAGKFSSLRVNLIDDSIGIFSIKNSRFNIFGADFFSDFNKRFKYFLKCRCLRSQKKSSIAYKSDNLNLKNFGNRKIKRRDPKKKETSASENTSDISCLSDEKKKNNSIIDSPYSYQAGKQSVKVKEISPEKLSRPAFPNYKNDIDQIETNSRIRRSIFEGAQSTANSTKNNNKINDNPSSFLPANNLNNSPINLSL